MLYLRGMRIMMIEFPGFYCKSLGDMDFRVLSPEQVRMACP